MPADTLLVPIDFTVCSFLVAARAGELAARLGGQVVLLHVTRPPAGIAPSVGVAPDGEDTTVGEYLQARARAGLAPYVAAAEAGGAPVSARVQAGAVVETIHAVAGEIGADMLVMGTHGRTGLARAVLGSVAEQTLRTAHVPVLMIRRQPQPDCTAQSCDWCQLGVRSDGERAMASELDG